MPDPNRDNIYFHLYSVEGNCCAMEDIFIDSATAAIGIALKLLYYSIYLLMSTGDLVQSLQKNGYDYK
jgi:hypothetical protein